MTPDETIGHLLLSVFLEVTEVGYIQDLLHTLQVLKVFITFLF